MTKALDVQHRLGALSPKIANPLRQLLAADQLGQDVLVTILDAADLADDHTKLLAFTAAYLYLRSQAVPITDVIRMAKHLNHRVNLGWSAKRWKAEHNRLSRAEALLRLSQEQVTYDVSDYQPLLPDSFPGYLIRTSRRLGMEGLRQRHCVASYHPSLRTGSCALAVVFVNHVRWTVQLVKTHHPAAPLRIAQIKSRFNQSPPPEVTTQIHQMLDIPCPPAAPEKRPAPQ